jgi:hypothetical protein
MSSRSRGPRLILPASAVRLSGDGSRPNGAARRRRARMRSSLKAIERQAGPNSMRLANCDAQPNVFAKRDWRLLDGESVPYRALGLLSGSDQPSTDQGVRSSPDPATAATPPSPDLDPRDAGTPPRPRRSSSPPKSSDKGTTSLGTSSPE